MTFNDSLVYFAPQTETTHLFSVKNLDAMVKSCSNLKLPSIAARKISGRQALDSRTLGDIGLNPHQVSFRVMGRDLV